MFSILVDADSLPVRERAVILKRAYKEDLVAVFVADRPLGDVLDMIKEHKAKLRSPYKDILDKTERRKICSTISMIVVEKGENSADDRIAALAKEGDIVITHDVPLSERCISKGAVAIDDRGNVYTAENIRTRLSERNYMKDLREMGINIEKQKRIGDRELSDFSNSFDSLIAKAKKNTD